MSDKHLSWKEYIELYSEFEHPPSTYFHKHVSKRIAKFLTYFFVKIDASPNLISICSFFLLFLGISCFYFIDSHNLACLAFLLLSQLSYAFDCSDGVVARINKRTSSFGGFLDLTLDRLSSNLLMLGTIGYLYTQEASIQIILISLIAFLSYQFYSYISDIRGFMFKSLKGYTNSIGDKSIKRLSILFIYEFIDTGTFYFILFLGFYFSLMLEILIFYLIISWILISANYLVIFRELD